MPDYKKWLKVSTLPNQAIFKDVKQEDEPMEETKDQVSSSSNKQLAKLLQDSAF